MPFVSGALQDAQHVAAHAIDIADGVSTAELERACGAGTQTGALEAMATCNCNCMLSYDRSMAGPRGPQATALRPGMPY